MTVPLFILIAVGTLLPRVPSHSAGDAIDDDALARLRALAESYKRLEYYEDRGSRSVEMVIAGETIQWTDSYTFAYQRPNRILIDFPNARLVSDGQTMISTLKPVDRYQEIEGPESINRGNVAPTSAGSALLGDPLGPPLLLVLEMLTGEASEEGFLRSLESATIEEDVEQNDQTLQVVRISRLGRSDLRLLIDPQLQRLVGAELFVSGDEVTDLVPPGVSVDRIEVRWTPGSIRTEPPEAGEGTTVFDTQPLPGTESVGTLIDP